MSADFTYVPTWSGMAYVAFVIDAYSRRILGWRATTIGSRCRSALAWGAFLGISHLLSGSEDGPAQEIASATVVLDAVLRRLRLTGGGPSRV